jgi:hypothetical protein
MEVHMRLLCRAVLRLVAFGTLAVSLVAATVAAQGQPSQPRTQWGTPDLQGTWSFATVTPLERPAAVTKEFLTAAEIAEFERKAVIAATDESRGADAVSDLAVAYNAFWYDRGTRTAGRRTSLISDPPNGKLPPLTPAAQKYADSPEAKMVQERRAGNLPLDGPENQSLWVRCLTRGLPIVPGPYNNNLRIFQTRDHVVIMTEMVHETRIVPLNDRPHLPPTVPLWMGDSHGRWDGDTLVVETRNISENQELPFAPRIFSASGMTLTERFSRSRDGSLRYEFTVNDPKIYTRPWTAVLEMVPAEGAMFEYACHEGNHSMEGILKGSRLLDKTASAVR